MIYTHLGYKKRLLTEQRIVDRAYERQYRNQRRTLGFWSLFFMLLFVLVALYPLFIFLYGKYGQ